MVWCPFCHSRKPGKRDDNGFIWCEPCGKIVHQDVFVEEPTFVKGPGGESQFVGSIVKSIQNGCSQSVERIVNKATMVIEAMVVQLEISGGTSIISQASAFYRVAVERSFTRGRKSDQVAAACLYIACRENNKPFLLIDFSMHLKTNVYVLGAVFLQLCKLLRLEEHPIVQKPIDPSLFIHRFADLRPASLIITSMKRDWMQTGRKPSGLCGAAIYISALSHGFKYSKLDIVRAVHICEATLAKRLIEFENTTSGSLTIEEFNKIAEELEQNSCKLSDVGSKRSGEMEMVCVHKGKGDPPFAHGLCRRCYEEFIIISGGLHGGSDPPAFQCAEMERIAKVSAEKFTNVEPFSDANQNMINSARTKWTEESKSVRAANGDQVTNDGASYMSQKFEDMNTLADELDCFSDIDDVEVNDYLNNKEEIHYKKIIWEEMNKEYLEEQAAKEAAAAAAAVTYVSEASDELCAAQELAAAAAAAVAKLRKERQQKRALEAKNASPAETAAEAAHQMLTKKRLSSKINYDVLAKLFDCDTLVPDPNKSHIESHQCQ
ncbi:hypothetical protein L1049_009970 [Liquidambar formosana]|uniref:Uncharacterized protein n=1 Tax=Liquidambar formosana TaxID=63359 RepID=A0AAP0N6P2_LIQFO